MGIQLIETREQFSKLNDKTSFFLLKHSLTCPISGEAKDQYESFAANTSVPLYMLHVQEARPLSNEIAEQYKVKHESPQALLFSEGKIIWNASHWDITENTLKEVEEQYVTQKEPK
ncbi:bacillithiol system protein YtxJ [Salirhabdus euzebyi]|uniref:Bacillithiol system protein YtxJ n=1 Tax=Salirhabdus euzebyi TaxID=394506 RepID=A0A841Q1R0_9BACI|nr:bacillithiol system redox-active protein YtxJ [Salirhabdus euzebyi]MBB6452142.1 bacillithiol system protein YtxJ [Salirhabdus euzebyi]